MLSSIAVAEQALCACVSGEVACLMTWCAVGFPRGVDRGVSDGVWPWQGAAVTQFIIQ